ncbi:MAG: hypothetical protein ACTHK0_12495 [Ginsengibacter sp.]
MKKLTIVLMLLISIPVGLYAQIKTASKSDKAFAVPENIIIVRRVYIDFGKKNKLKIELTDLSDLQRIADMDSLLQIFKNDMAPLKDSFLNPLTSKKVDYMADAKGRKKIRFQQFQPEGASFLLDNGELASLRTEQDTINIIGVITDPPKPKDRISRTNPRYYHLTFYLNNIEELANYMNGTLNEKIKTIQNNISGKWPTVLGTGYHYIKNDKTVFADHPKGFTNAGIGDFLNGYVSVNVQNYKNYFVPSFSVGTELTLTNGDRNFKWVPGLFWEPHFLFAKDADGKLHTYRNDFLTLSYGQGGTTDHDPRKDFSFSAVFSLGYLIHREGEFIDKHTFRLGAGKLKLLKTTIEPSMYFNNFFKGVTPGIRVSQTF